jgi:hypothetical protein
MSNKENSPGNQSPQESGDDAWPGDINSLTPGEQEEALDRILDSNEGNSLGIFRQDLAKNWDTMPEQEKADILDEFPQLMDGQ